MTNAQTAAIAQAVAVALAQVIGQMPASAKIGKATKAKAKKLAKRTPEQVQVDLEKAVRKAGFQGAVVPHETVRTYDGWLSVGRRVMKGQKGLPGFKSLFHLEQTAEEPAKA